MNLPYTYRHKSGIYYFRLVKYHRKDSCHTEIRFSLRTRNPHEAKVRSMTAWVCAQNFLASSSLSASDIRSEIQQLLFSNSNDPHGPIVEVAIKAPLVHSQASSPNLNPHTIHKIIDGNNISYELRAYAKRKYDGEQWNYKTKLENDCVFSTFVEIIGDKPVSEITKADITRYANVVDYLPPNRKKKVEFRELSPSDAAKKNRLRGGQRLSIVQRRKYFSVLSSLFNEFVDEGLIDFNYFQRFKGKRTGLQKKRTVRMPFSIGDLQTMYECDLSLELLAKQTCRPSRVWGMLIALFTGARAEEIFSLSLANIQNQDGTYFFNIDDSVNSVKTVAAHRGIPVHPKLVELGFLDFVERSRRVQRREQVPMLFPELKEDKRHGYRRGPTRWFNNVYLKYLGIKKPGKCFHSYRHTVADCMKRGRQIIDSGKASQFIGHEDRRGPLWEHLYGSPFTPKELLEITKVIHYEVDFSTLKKQCLDHLNPVRR